MRIAPHGGRRRGGLAVAGALLLLGALGACDRPGEPGAQGGAAAAGIDTGVPAADADAGAGGAPAALPVDSTLPRAVAGREGWMYSRAAESDLDGDGQAERVVLTARAGVRDGRPVWDDGQPWQVYVEEAEGTRTHLYARFVQLGSVEMRIGLAEGGRSPTVVLVEHVPDRLAVYEIAYRGPGDAEVVHRYERMLDPTGELASPRLPEF